MVDNIMVTRLPDGGCVVEHDGEVAEYSAEEVAEIEREGMEVLERLANR